MELIEKTLKKNYVFHGKIISVRQDEALLPNGKTAIREVVEHNGGVCIAPLTADRELIFVRQFRYPYSQVVLELPAGKLEKGEDAYEAGVRELEEETGYASDDFVDCGVFLPSPGYCGEVIHLYAACNLKQTEMNLDEDEFLETEKIPLDKAVEMVMDNRIVDGKSQVLILKTANLVREGKV